MSRIYSMELAGRTLSVEIGKLAEQANGAALVKYGDTVVLSTATASSKPREGIDFFPLSVDYEERLYSVGKIPGGFIKREGRASENAVLTSRVIDRPIRPLFPKDYRNDCAVVNTVMCVDQDAQPEFAAMVGSSVALAISDIPFEGPIGSVFIGLVDGELVVNPTSEERDKTDMTVIVASTLEKVVMIEAAANEVGDETMLQAIRKAHEINRTIVEWINGIVAKEGKPKHTYQTSSVPEELLGAVRAHITDDRMEAAVFTDIRQERDVRMAAIHAELKEKFEEGNPEWIPWIGEALYQYEKKTVRKMILKDHKRPDGRELDEIRKLSAEVDILPRTHGSALFSRGQTQVLTITTLGALGEMQRLDGLDELETSKRYIHHYNFPPYSVGEVRPMRGPGRREIGHGALAEKALIPVLPDEETFPYAIRTVSEVVSSNGSTSQGSICASSMSLMAAGVPLKAPVAGISCGLVTGDSDDDYILLTDIQGLEDFFGDMDFKVAGTHKGITAIQMDIKIKGLTFEIIEKSIHQTHKARLYILDEVMAPAIAKGRDEISPYAPQIVQIMVDPEKISEIIGPRGKTINRIIDETGVKIDIEDDGRVFICGSDRNGVDKAIRIIETIGKEIEVGAIYTGKVVRIMNFGAFVELAPGKDGLVHISKLAKERVNKVEDVVNIGDEIVVKVTEIDQQGRINLSRKAVLEGSDSN
ncbi:polyribonucleotide nucleotidyltransferase [Anaerotalea alkaliphila]|uniref:Polyribonucleotide nucleotidyltransferase n=1 Tax=Anaerotalea alkaliphila TaxID=2662126 RepID=A0A7X5HTE1_9FIRM|nr:polyribonucleotide nucleotidyltransferase [Anaerotalea alkaliphila]NDL66327.1 polyribonucleotide nucleotidyltransferase [Anaerotalea alkaliphila]